MSDDAPARPRQVTLAAGLIIVGSVFVVATVFEQVSGLRSLESQDAAREFLSEPPGSGLGMTVDGVLLFLRVMAMTAGACAAAAAILGYFVLQRSKPARLGLAILAGPLLVSGVAAGGILSSVVAAAAVMLWFQPARDWFDGVKRRPEASPRAGSPWSAPDQGRDQGRDAGPGWPPPQAPQAPATSEPRAVQGFGSPTAVRTPWAPDPDPGTGAWGPSAPPAKRPGAVVWACALTWACCGLAVVGMALTVLVLAASPDAVFDEIRRTNPDLADQGMSESALLNATFVTAGLVALWALSAGGLAVMVWRRVPWARVALLVSTGLAGVLLVLATAATLVLALPLVACSATFFLLLRPEVRSWFDLRGSMTP